MVRCGGKSCFQDLGSVHSREVARAKTETRHGGLEVSSGAAEGAGEDGLKGAAIPTLCAQKCLVLPAQTPTNYSCGN